MNKYTEYEREKEKLERRALTPQEYEAAIMALCRRLKI